MLSAICPPRARRFRAGARRRARRWSTRSPCRPPARLGEARAADRAAESRGPTDRLAPALTRLGPSYVKLGQFLATRPDIVGPAVARDLESCRTGSRRSRRRSRKPRRGSARQAGRADFRVVRPGGRGGLDRAGAQGEADGRTVAVKVLRPASSGASSAISTRVSRGAHRRALFGRGPAPPA